MPRSHQVSKTSRLIGRAKIENPFREVTPISQREKNHLFRAKTIVAYPGICEHDNTPKTCSKPVFWLGSGRIMPDRLKVFISAYACEPNKGSEPAVGWQLALHMARFHDVTVLTRANNQENIEKALDRIDTWTKKNL